jgi:hypothetical protein
VKQEAASREEVKVRVAIKKLEEREAECESGGSEREGVRTEMSRGRLKKSGTETVIRL